MRIRQLREEGATEDIDVELHLKDYYDRHMAGGTFVCWLATDFGYEYIFIEHNSEELLLVAGGCGFCVAGTKFL